MRGFRRAGVLIGAFALLLLGCAGLVLPLIPGIPLLVVALVLLATEFIWAHRMIKRIRMRFPWTAPLLDRVTPPGD